MQPWQLTITVLVRSDKPMSALARQFATVAENEIGSPGTLSATITQGNANSIFSGGALEVDAYSTQTVNALTLAGSAAISGGGATGVAVAGAGSRVSDEGAGRGLQRLPPVRPRLYQSGSASVKSSDRSVRRTT